MENKDTVKIQRLNTNLVFTASTVSVEGPTMTAYQQPIPAFRFCKQFYESTLGQDNIWIDFITEET